MAPTTQTFSTRSVRRSAKEPLSLLAAVESTRHGPNLSGHYPNPPARNDARHDQEGASIWRFGLSLKAETLAAG